MNTDIFKDSWHGYKKQAKYYRQIHPIEQYIYLNNV